MQLALVAIHFIIHITYGCVDFGKNGRRLPYTPGKMRTHFSGWLFQAEMLARGRCAKPSGARRANPRHEGVAFTGRAGVLALWLLAASFAHAAAQRPPIDDDPQSRRDSPVDVANTKARALALLKDIVPAPHTSPGAVGFGRLMESEQGSVQWGRLFSDHETSALVRVPVVHPPDPAVVPHEPVRGYLSFLAWSNGHWVYRQFLGQVDDLSLHQHQGKAYLLGSFKIGRNDGEHFSWRYDEHLRRLVETHWENWGPFYLAGHYLVCTRGFERHARWETHWVYRFKDGRKGPLVACLHQDEHGRFTVTFRRARNGRLVSWAFQPDSEGSTRYLVSRIKTPDAIATDQEGIATVTVTAPHTNPESSEEGVSENEAARCFQRLTGLNPYLLEEKWRDRLPNAPSLRGVKIEATRNAEMVLRLRQTRR